MIGSFSLQAHFCENDSQNGALFIPANQIRLAFGRDHDVNCLPKSFLGGAMFQIRIKKHQDERLARALRSPALQA